MNLCPKLGLLKSWLAGNEYVCAFLVSVCERQRKEERGGGGREKEAPIAKGDRVMKSFCSSVHKWKKDGQIDQEIIALCEQFYFRDVLFETRYRHAGHWGCSTCRSKLLV